MTDDELLDIMAKMTPYICQGYGWDHYTRLKIVVYGEILPFNPQNSAMLPFYQRWGGHFHEELVKNRLSWQCPTYMTMELLKELMPYLKKYKMHVHIRVAEGIIG